MTEPDPSWNAQIDQALAGAADMAKITAAFWRSLVEQGLDATAATEITVAYLVASMNNAQGNAGGEES